ncbi:MAG TPA: glucan biosynthesis protein [Candidatus Competibacter sp.]|nr:glucan biosynthesis protein [Candidatus Competibacter sp.]
MSYHFISSHRFALHPLQWGRLAIMKCSITRRSFLGTALLTPWLSMLLGAEVRADQKPLADLQFGPAQPFSFDWLREHAKQLAAQAYQPPVVRHAETIEKIDYDAHQEIQYRPDAALWRQQGVAYPVRFFHLGRLFPTPVKIHAVREGAAREIFYSSRLFAFGEAEFAANLPDDLGFAGFRIMHSQTEERDWLAFLGASYFRSSGELDQYGISARGVAVNTGLPTPEEFPRFSQFWLEPTADPQAVMVYALLDGPSLTGAYRIQALRHERVIMEVEATLFFRKDIQRLGVAPLTSMYWFSESNHQPSWDWRPEVHDSDGMALWTGAGERIWRPINNPPFVHVSTFVDENPKGFGLSQRDRNFENYQDDRVFYERRPTLWVEPLEPWGAGAVQLIEIPTDYEADDNLVACWVPREPARAGDTRTYKYRLHWVADEPYAPDRSRVVATRISWRTIAKTPLRPAHRIWFAIDFAGGPLDQIDRKEPVELIASTTRGHLRSPGAFQVTGARRWRADFEIELEGGEPIDLRAYLRLGEQALSETWLYQFIPRASTG